jgi:cytochrome c biogenesis protein ResB
VYRISYDVDRKPLGFELKLDDFDVGFDPGTDQASSFASQVRLTDKSAGIDQKPITISMNEPLTHNGYTFYQSSYERMRDPRTNRETGQFASVFQVAVDPGRRIKYFGCALVVLGAFVQFYMRAGVFSDGGKRERQKSVKEQRAKASSNGHATGPSLSSAHLPAEQQVGVDEEEIL